MVRAEYAAAWRGVIRRLVGYIPLKSRAIASKVRALTLSSGYDFHRLERFQ